MSEKMNLQEHKLFVREYERLLENLRAVRRVRPEDEWKATTYGDFVIAIPADTAHKILREYVLEAEKRAKEMAGKLGITVEDSE